MDKGRSTVVLDRTDYFQKPKGLLEGRQFYVPSAMKPVKALTHGIKATLWALEKRKGDLAIETIELLLQSKYDEMENHLGHAPALQLLKFCLSTYFTFDGAIYEQVKGAPIGSPISGFIAEAALQRDQLLTFKEHLNAVFPDIRFTMEEDENNQLAFLNVLVCRKDCGGLKTEAFRKVINTMQVLNFNINHLISHKGSCVRTLYRRVETHCSEPEDKIAELQ
ncbi:hypothetical protein SprV_0200928300 [Sparganum proliferum]